MAYLTRSEQISQLEKVLSELVDQQKGQQHLNYNSHSLKSAFMMFSMEVSKEGVGGLYLRLFVKFYLFFQCKVLAMLLTPRF